MKVLVLAGCLLLSGCATGEFSNARIEDRAQKFLSWCLKESAYDFNTCHGMADRQRREDIAYRSSFHRFYDVLGGGKHGAGTGVPVQVYVTN